MREDQSAYFCFTGPARLDKAMHSLEGILKGVLADACVSDGEVRALTVWLDEHTPLMHRHPFSEIIPALRRAMADGVLDCEEIADALWLCQRLQLEHPYYCEISADMQELHGLLGGVVADGEVTASELDTIRDWLEEHDHLRCCWPYDEIDALLTWARADHRIDEHEQRTLFAFFSQFSTTRGNRALDLPLNEVATPITGVCAVCPEVAFGEKLFCFTGSSCKCTRSELSRMVEQRGGRFTDRLTQAVDYLVIGADGNPCWAFSCYGRKVEAAVALRKQGHTIMLVHENDFWDAIG